MTLVVLQFNGCYPVLVFVGETMLVDWLVLRVQITVELSKICVTREEAFRVSSLADMESLKSIHSSRILLRSFIVRLALRSLLILGLVRLLYTLLCVVCTILWGGCWRISSSQVTLGSLVASVDQRFRQTIPLRSLVSCHGGTWYVTNIHSLSWTLALAINGRSLLLLVYSDGVFLS